MRAYTVTEAATDFDRLIREAHSGEDVVITKDRTPVVRVVALKNRIPGGYEEQYPGNKMLSIHLPTRR